MYYHVIEYYLALKKKEILPLKQIYTSIYIWKFIHWQL